MGQYWEFANYVSSFPQEQWVDGLFEHRNGSKNMLDDWQHCAHDMAFWMNRLDDFTSLPQICTFECRSHLLCVPFGMQVSFPFGSENCICGPSPRYGYHVFRRTSFDRKCVPVGVGIPVPVVNLDVSKAFDRVHWPALWKNLLEHGSSEHMLWIRSKILRKVIRRRAARMCFEPSSLLYRATVCHGEIEIESWWLWF